MPERTHLSIGEVLSLLREEFPDVTISKIRFLESQGLVDPERTPSGYRKFYDHDVERLRWILRQQRENFLPLKIIRGRLTEQGEEVEDNGDTDARPETDTDGITGNHGGTRPLPDTAEAGVEYAVGSRDATIEASSSAHPAAATRQRGPAAGAPVASAPGAASAPTPGTGSAAVGPEPVAAPGTSASPGLPPAGRSAPAGTALGSSTGSSTTSGPTGGGSSRAGQSAAAGPRPAGRNRGGAGQQPALDEEVETFSPEELAEACGGTVAMVTDLQQYGLIAARVVVGGTPYFDASALDVARAAAGFSRHGVEARHLRAWRNAADREAGIFEQVIVPLLRQRNPEARRQAAATLAELAALGGDLRKAFVDQALRQIR